MPYTARKDHGPADWIPSAKYREDKRQLLNMINSSTHGPAMEREISDWLDLTLDMHRAQADALARREIEERRLNRWYWRIFGEWAPWLMVGILAVGMLVIGLVNGWS